MPLTLEERERRAYAEGRVAEAALLAQVLDAKEEADDELRHEADMWKAEVQSRDEDIDELRTTIGDLEGENAKLREQLPDLDPLY